MVSTIYFYGPESEGKTYTREQLLKKYGGVMIPIDNDAWESSCYINFTSGKRRLVETNTLPEVSQEDLLVSFLPLSKDKVSAIVNGRRVEQAELLSEEYF